MEKEKPTFQLKDDNEEETNNDEENGWIKYINDSSHISIEDIKQFSRLNHF